MLNVSFKGAQDPLVLQLSQNNVQAQAKQTAPIVNQPQADVVETQGPKKKVPLRQKFLNFVASIKKTGVNISEYGKAFLKGVAKSALGAAATVGALFTGHQIHAAIKQNEGFTKVVSGIFKNMSNGIKKNLTKDGIKSTLKTGRGIGAVAAGVLIAAGVMIKTLYDATLQANQKKHNIDEKYQKTPAIVKY